MKPYDALLYRSASLIDAVDEAMKTSLDNVQEWHDFRTLLVALVSCGFSPKARRWLEIRNIEPPVGFHGYGPDVDPEAVWRRVEVVNVNLGSPT